jgi:hypothetical protein
MEQKKESSSSDSGEPGLTFLTKQGEGWEDTDGYEENELTHFKNKFMGSFYNLSRTPEAAPMFSRDPIWFVGKCYVMNVQEVDQKGLD